MNQLSYCKSNWKKCKLEKYGLQTLLKMEGMSIGMNVEQNNVYVCPIIESVFEQFTNIRLTRPLP